MSEDAMMMMMRAARCEYNTNKDGKSEMTRAHKQEHEMIECQCHMHRFPSRVGGSARPRKRGRNLIQAQSD